MSDAGTAYRSKDEINEYRNKKDCLLFLENMILDNKVLKEAEIKDIEKKIRKEIDEAAEECKKSPHPSVSRLTEHVEINKLAPIRGSTYKNV